MMLRFGLGPNGCSMHGYRGYQWIVAKLAGKSTNLWFCDSLLNNVPLLLYLPPKLQNLSYWANTQIIVRTTSTTIFVGYQHPDTKTHSQFLEVSFDAIAGCATHDWREMLNVALKHDARNLRIPFVAGDVAFWRFELFGGGQTIGEHPHDHTEIPKCDWKDE